MTFKEAVEKYVNNMKESILLSDSLFKKTDEESWHKALYKRAERLSKIYQENNEILDSLPNYFLSDIKKEEIEEIYNITSEAYDNDFDDAALLIPIFQKLEEYYEKNWSDNILALTHIYCMHAYEVHEYIVRCDPSLPLEIELYKKVLKFKDYYNVFLNEPKRRRDFFVAYYNVIVASDGLAGIDPNETYDYLLELEEFYNQEEIKELEKGTVNEELYYETRRSWLMIYARYDKLSDRVKDALFERAKEGIKENLFDSEFEYFFAYNRCLFARGEITKEELLDRALKYYSPRMEEILKMEKPSDEEFFFVFDTPVNVLKWLDLKGDASLDNVYLKLKELINEVWNNKVITTKQSPYVNSLMSDWIIASMPYEHDKESLEQTIFDNLVKRQAPTYIHSVMVMCIAELIYEYMDKSLLPDIENPLEFIKNSALLHDVGKSKIADIINMQRRKLMDIEFKGIRSHPEYGSEILLKTPLLEQYTDIVKGHHKWYNGLGGYPKDFDNTKSKYRIIIDLITISDCLDAATDPYGRNYKNSKTVKDVLKEFEADKGVKYNPYFVDLLCNNPEIIEKLEDLTQLERPKFMYNAYMKKAFKRE